MNFCKTFILTERNLAAVFYAKTTNFDVIMIRKMNFQAVTKYFLKMSQKSQFWSKIGFFFPKINFHFLSWLKWLFTISRVSLWKKNEF